MRIALAIVLLTLRERRRLLLWMSFSIVVMMIYMFLVYPSFAANNSYEKLVEGMSPQMKAFFSIDSDLFGSGAGYLNTELFSFMVPVLLLVMGIGGAVGVTTGDEDRSRMDVLLSCPVSRTTLLLSRFVGLAIVLLIPVVVLLVVSMVGGPFADMGLNNGNLVAAHAMAWLYGLQYTALALAVASIAGSSGLAQGATIAIAFVSYLTSSLGNLIDGLRTIAGYTSFHHYISGSPLLNGMDWNGAAWLAGTTVVLVTVAAFGFARRDIRN